MATARAQATFYFTSFTDDQAAPTFANYAVSAPASATDWDWKYIRKANIMLERIDQAPIPTKQRTTGKASPVSSGRSVIFQLVRAYGDVPWIGRSWTFSKTGVIYKPRDSRVLVMDSVLADINFAADNLRVRTSPIILNLTNTINIDIALAFKSRLCLYEGTYRKYHTELGLTGADKVSHAGEGRSFKTLHRICVFVTRDCKAIFNTIDFLADRQQKKYCSLKDNIARYPHPFCSRLFTTGW